MKNSDINLMDDNQNEWDDEDPDSRRFRVRGTSLYMREELHFI